MSTNTFNIKTGGTEVAAVFASRIKGKTVVITGVNPVGLGGALANAVATQDPELLLLTYHTAAKGEAVKDDILKNFPSLKIVLLELDLGDFDSVRKAVKAIKKTTDHIDLLFNNGGVMSVQDRVLTKAGIESQFAINHIGPFIFTNMLMDLIITSSKRNEPGSTRIINMAAGWHRFSPVRFTDINFSGAAIPEHEQPDLESLAKFAHRIDDVSAYTPEVAYAQSKSATIMSAIYLTKHLKRFGILSFGVNPGGILTEIGRFLPEEKAAGIIASGLLNKTPETGAAPVLVAALDPTLTAESKPFFHEDCQPADPKPWTTDDALVEKLWHVSEDLAGEKFDLSKLDLGSHSASTAL